MAQLLRARASELTLGLEGGPEKPPRYAVDLEACWGDPDVPIGPDGCRILDAPSEATHWQRVLAACPGRKRHGWAEQPLEMLGVMHWVRLVEQNCRDDPGVQDGLDARDAPDAPDALDGRKQWKEQAPAVELEPREAAQRPHALQRELLFSPVALFGSLLPGR